jgi:hypothetical protein
MNGEGLDEAAVCVTLFLVENGSTECRPTIKRALHGEG